MHVEEAAAPRGRATFCSFVVVDVETPTVACSGCGRTQNFCRNGSTEIELCFETAGGFSVMCYFIFGASGEMLGARACERWEREVVA